MSLSIAATILRLCISIFAAGTLTGFVRWVTLERSILDHPNERSLHSSPTPRGGGLAIVAVVLVYIAWLALTNAIEPRSAIGIGVGSILVALIGGVDDLARTPPLLRLSVHFLAAIWVVLWLGGFSSLQVGTHLVHLGFAGTVIAIVGIVWFTNLFNFMDGIDGIAGVEALFICAVGGVILVWQGSPLGDLALVTAGASLGFLWWNWEPARIFLGDIGSGFLGFVLAAIALSSEKSGGPPIIVWAILGSVFIFDATATFVRRLRAGYWHQAHKSHAYQRLVQAGWSHSRVVSAIATINVFFCALALLAFAKPSWTVALMAVAFSTAATVYGLVERLSPFNVVPEGTAAGISQS